MNAWLTNHQTLSCLGAVLIGVVLGLGVPGATEAAGVLVTPVLILLLFATFVDIPLDRLGAVRTGGWFTSAVLVLNFAVVPLVVAALHRLVPLPGTVVVAVLVVLLTPCVDYVIVFTCLAGGASGRLLALTPLLMVAQIVLLPVWLRFILGPGAAVLVSPRPFVGALLLFIIVPLLAALVLRLCARRITVAERGLASVSTAMMPLMLLTLAVVAAAEVPVIPPHLGELGSALFFFAVFVLVMTCLGWALGRWLLPEADERRALVFTGVTRNSLVVLPLVRAVDGDGPGSAAVVSQTLLELIVMVVLVWIVPRLIPRIAMSENR